MNTPPVCSTVGCTRPRAKNGFTKAGTQSYRPTCAPCITRSEPRPVPRAELTRAEVLAILAGMVDEPSTPPSVRIQAAQTWLTHNSADATLSPEVALAALRDEVNSDEHSPEASDDVQ